METSKTKSSVFLDFKKNIDLLKNSDYNFFYRSVNTNLELKIPNISEKHYDFRNIKNVEDLSYVFSITKCIKSTGDNFYDKILNKLNVFVFIYYDYFRSVDKFRLSDDVKNIEKSLDYFGMNNNQELWKINNKIDIVLDRNVYLSSVDFVKNLSDNLFNKKSYFIKDIGAEILIDKNDIEIFNYVEGKLSKVSDEKKIKDIKKNISNNKISYMDTLMHCINETNSGNNNIIDIDYNNSLSLLFKKFKYNVINNLQIDFIFDDFVSSFAKDIKIDRTFFFRGFAVIYLKYIDNIIKSNIKEKNIIAEELYNVKSFLCFLNAVRGNMENSYNNTSLVNKFLNNGVDLLEIDFDKYNYNACDKSLNNVGKLFFRIREVFDGCNKIKKALQENSSCNVLIKNNNGFCGIVEDIPNIKSAIYKLNKNRNLSFILNNLSKEISNTNLTISAFMQEIGKSVEKDIKIKEKTDIQKLENFKIFANSKIAKINELFKINHEIVNEISSNFNNNISTTIFQKIVDLKNKCFTDEIIFSFGDVDNIDNARYNFNYFLDGICKKYTESYIELQEYIGIFKEYESLKNDFDNKLLNEDEIFLCKKLDSITNYNFINVISEINEKFKNLDFSDVNINYEYKNLLDSIDFFKNNYSNKIKTIEYINNCFTNTIDGIESNCDNLINIKSKIELLNNIDFKELLFFCRQYKKQIESNMQIIGDIKLKNLIFLNDITENADYELPENNFIIKENEIFYKDGKKPGYSKKLISFFENIKERSFIHDGRVKCLYIEKAKEFFIDLLNDKALNNLKLFFYKEKHEDIDKILSLIILAINDDIDIKFSDDQIKILSNPDIFEVKDLKFYDCLKKLKYLVNDFSKVVKLFINYKANCDRKNEQEYFNKNTKDFILENSRNEFLKLLSNGYTIIPSEVEYATGSYSKYLQTKSKSSIILDINFTYYSRNLIAKDKEEFKLFDNIEINNEILKIWSKKTDLEVKNKIIQIGEIINGYKIDLEKNQKKRLDDFNCEVEKYNYIKKEYLLGQQLLEKTIFDYNSNNEKDIDILYKKRQEIFNNLNDFKEIKKFEFETNDIDFCKIDNINAMCYLNTLKLALNLNYNNKYVELYNNLSSYQSKICNNNFKFGIIKNIENDKVNYSDYSIIGNYEDLNSKLGYCYDNFNTIVFEFFNNERQKLINNLKSTDNDKFNADYENVKNICECIENAKRYIDCVNFNDINCIIENIDSIVINNNDLNTDLFYNYNYDILNENNINNIKSVNEAKKFTKFIITKEDNSLEKIFAKCNNYINEKIEIFNNKLSDLKIINNIDNTKFLDDLILRFNEIKSIQNINEFSNVLELLKSDLKIISDKKNSYNDLRNELENFFEYEIPAIKVIAKNKCNNIRNDYFNDNIKIDNFYTELDDTINSNLIFKKNNISVNIKDNETFDISNIFNESVYNIFSSESIEDSINILNKAFYGIKTIENIAIKNCDKIIENNEILKNNELKIGNFLDNIIEENENCNLSNIQNFDKIKEFFKDKKTLDCFIHDFICSLEEGIKNENNEYIKKHENFINFLNEQNENFKNSISNNCDINKLLELENNYKEIDCSLNIFVENKNINFLFLNKYIKNCFNNDIIKFFENNIEIEFSDLVSSSLLMMQSRKLIITNGFKKLNSNNLFIDNNLVNNTNYSIEKQKFEDVDNLLYNDLFDNEFHKDRNIVLNDIKNKIAGNVYVIVNNLEDSCKNLFFENKNLFFDDLKKDLIKSIDYNEKINLDMYNIGDFIIDKLEDCEIYEIIKNINELNDFCSKNITNLKIEILNYSNKQRELDLLKLENFNFEKTSNKKLDINLGNLLIEIKNRVVNNYTFDYEELNKSNNLVDSLNNINLKISEVNNIINEDKLKISKLENDYNSQSKRDLLFYNLINCISYDNLSDDDKIKIDNIVNNLNISIDNAEEDLRRLEIREINNNENITKYKDNIRNIILDREKHINTLNKRLDEESSNLYKNIFSISSIENIENNIDNSESNKKIINIIKDIENNIEFDSKYEEKTFKGIGEYKNLIIEKLALNRCIQRLNKIKSNSQQNKNKIKDILFETFKVDTFFSPKITENKNYISDKLDKDNFKVESENNILYLVDISTNEKIVCIDTLQDRSFSEKDEYNEINLITNYRNIIILQIKNHINELVDKVELKNNFARLAIDTDLLLDVNNINSLFGSIFIENNIENILPTENNIVIFRKLQKYLSYLPSIKSFLYEVSNYERDILKNTVNKDLTKDCTINTPFFVNGVPVNQTNKIKSICELIKIINNDDYDFSGRINKEINEKFICDIEKSINKYEEVVNNKFLDYNKSTDLIKKQKDILQALENITNVNSSSDFGDYEGYNYEQLEKLFVIHKTSLKNIINKNEEIIDNFKKQYNDCIENINNTEIICNNVFDDINESIDNIIDKNNQGDFEIVNNINYYNCLRFDTMKDQMLNLSINTENIQNLNNKANDYNLDNNQAKQLVNCLYFKKEQENIKYNFESLINLYINCCDPENKYKNIDEKILFISNNADRIKYNIYSIDNNKSLIELQNMLCNSLLNDNYCEFALDLIRNKFNDFKTIENLEFFVKNYKNHKDKAILKTFINDEISKIVSLISKSEYEKYKYCQCDHYKYNISNVFKNLIDNIEQIDKNIEQKSNFISFIESDNGYVSMFENIYQINRQDKITINKINKNFTSLRNDLSDEYKKFVQKNYNSIHFNDYKEEVVDGKRCMSFNKFLHKNVNINLKFEDKNNFNWINCDKYINKQTGFFFGFIDYYTNNCGQIDELKNSIFIKNRNIEKNVKNDNDIKIFMNILVFENEGKEALDINEREILCKIFNITKEKLDNLVEHRREIDIFNKVQMPNKIA